MGAQDEQVANIANNILNGSLQNVANYCSITCSDNISNLDVVIVGGNDTVNITQTCSIIGAECMIKSVINDQIENLISNIVNQTDNTMGIFSLLGPSTSETTNITNSVKNQVSQIISNTCYIESNNNITNTGVFAQDANLNLTFTQTGNVNKASCAMDTIAKLLINNDIKNTVKQTSSSCGDIIGIIIALLIVLILGFLVFIRSAIF